MDGNHLDIIEMKFGIDSHEIRDELEPPFRPLLLNNLDSVEEKV